MGGSVHSNEEEHLKTNYAAVDDSDAPVDKSPHKRGRVSALSNSNGFLDGSEHSIEEENQITEFAVENYCDASFDDTPPKKARFSAQDDYNGQPIPEGINPWWCS